MKEGRKLGSFEEKVPLPSGLSGVNRAFGGAKFSHYSTYLGTSVSKYLGT